MEGIIDLARDMARAIMRDRTARSSSPVGKDGRQRITYQHMQASAELDRTMTAFCAAVGMPVETPEQYTDAEAMRLWTGHEMPETGGAEPDLLTEAAPRISG